MHIPAGRADDGNPAHWPLPRRQSSAPGLTTPQSSAAPGPISPSCASCLLLAHTLRQTHGSLLQRKCSHPASLQPPLLRLELSHVLGPDLLQGVDVRRVLHAQDPLAPRASDGDEADGEEHGEC